MPKQHNECIVPKHCSIDIHACKCKFIYIILYFTLKGYKHVCMYVLCHSHQTQNAHRETCSYTYIKSNTSFLLHRKQ